MRSLQAYELVDNQDVQVEEQVALFLTTVGYDQWNWVGGLLFSRFGQTLIYYFRRVLNPCLALYKDVVTNVTANNSPYNKDNVRDRIWG